MYSVERADAVFVEDGGTTEEVVAGFWWELLSGSLIV